MAQGKANSAKTSSADRRGPLTWIVSGLGLAAIVAAIIILALDVANSRTPPDLRVAETRRITMAGVTRVEIEIRNLGGEAAAAIEVEGVSASGETGRVSLDYVAGRSRREATLAFPGDPGAVAVSVTGWTRP